MKNNNDRSCRKCGAYIPNWFKINGKRINARNRKFCLECSPYGSHNTKPHDPSSPNVPKKYKEKSEQNKKSSMKSQRIRGDERKKKIVELSGGECIKCGYKRCYSSLSFHHRDPSKKSFGLSTDKLRTSSWEKILEEVSKCDLLCLNCHMEVERGFTE
jgi:hypothetical protein